METLKNIIEYISIFMSIVLLVKLTNGILKMFQQSHYHLSYYKKIIKHYYIGDKTNILFPILIFLFFLNLWYIQLIYIVYIAGLLYLKHKQKDIIKLKYTARIKRLYLFILVFETLVASLILYVIHMVQLPSGLATIMILSPILIYISSFVMHPVELMISKYYQLKARRKLKDYRTTIVGITGSYGKTTTKNILFELLKNKYITFATEKSFNTLNGVSKNINEILTADHQIMIVEMGASHKGDIEKLVKLAKPKYAIVTEVGPQHLETFKDINNILNEKMKLIDCLPDDGIGIINYDNQLIKNYNIKSNCKVIKIGCMSDCDYQAFDIKQNINGIDFKVRFFNREENFHTNLLGIHNVINILASLALALELGVNLQEIKYEIANLKAVKNRLSIEEDNGITILNDAFNCNFEGFKNALEVLSYFKNTKILITPGIVEAGKEEERLNQSIASYIANVCDYVFLVKTKSSEYINKGLEEINYKNVKVFNKYVDAMAYVKENYRDSTVLIENDISDIYKI